MHGTCKYNINVSLKRQQFYDKSSVKIFFHHILFLFIFFVYSILSPLIYHQKGYPLANLHSTIS